MRRCPAPPVTDPRGDMFRILLESNRLAERVLAADRAAAAGREFYDDGFFAAFKRDALPIVDQRIADAIGATAAFITGAWERAGTPGRAHSAVADRRAGSPSRRRRRAGRPQPRPSGRRHTQWHAGFLIPIGRDEYEPYFEAADEPDDADEPAETRWFGRLRRQTARHAARSRGRAASLPRDRGARGRRRA